MTKLEKKKTYFFNVQKGATNTTILKNIAIAFIWMATHQESQTTLFAIELSFTAQETEQNERTTL